MAKVQRKLDVFDVLRHLDKKDRQYFKNLTEEQQKAFIPLIVMRWMSGTRNIRQIVFINELVNHLIFSLFKHKELLYYMLSVCGSGQTQRYMWNKTKSKSSSMPKTYIVLREYFDYNANQVVDIIPLLSNDDIIEYAEHLGRQPDELKIIKNELKNR